MQDELTIDLIAKANRVVAALRVSGASHNAFRRASVYTSKSGEVRVYTNEGKKGDYLEIRADGSVVRCRCNLTWGQLIDCSALSAC